MISNISNRKLRYRIYQSAFKGMIKTIEEIAEKEGVPVVKVNPRGSSSRCPVCGSYLMRSYAPRVMTCPKCGFSHDRDVIACINLWMRGFMPLAPRSMYPYLEVAVLPMKVWVKTNSLGATINLYKTIRITT